MDTALTAAGKAWKRVKSASKRMWSDWTMAIGPGLIKARTQAMFMAEVNEPEGKGYNMAMSDLLKRYELDDMDAGTRSHMLQIMEHLADVETWRAKQKDPLALNHPTSVWRGFQRSSKGQDNKDRKKSAARAQQTKEELALALVELHNREVEVEQLRAHIEDLEASREVNPLDRLPSLLSDLIEAAKNTTALEKALPEDTIFAKEEIANLIRKLEALDKHQAKRHGHERKKRAQARGRAAGSQWELCPRVSKKRGRRRNAPVIPSAETPDSCCRGEIPWTS